MQENNEENNEMQESDEASGLCVNLKLLSLQSDRRRIDFHFPSIL